MDNSKLEKLFRRLPIRLVTVVGAVAMACAMLSCTGTGAASQAPQVVEPQEVQVAPEALPPLPPLEWRLPDKYATLVGDRLVIDILSGAPSPGLFRRINQNWVVRYSDKPDTAEGGTGDKRQATSRGAACRNVEKSPGESRVACRASPASERVAVRDIAFEDTDVDFAGPLWNERIDDGAPSGFPFVTRGTQQLLVVDVQRYGRYLGNQQCELATDLSGFRVRYENIAFRRFRCHGDVPRLTGTVDSSTSPHTLSGLVLEDLPASLELTRKTATHS